MHETAQPRAPQSTFTGPVSAIYSRDMEVTFAAYAEVLEFLKSTLRN